MNFRQLLHHNPVGASYVFGCASKSVAAVCDPVDVPDLYVEIASRSGMRIQYVIDTHIHADHTSGGRRLADLTGAEYVLHESAETAFPCRRVRDADLLSLGNVLIEILHTPGHTPEHISLLVTDSTRAQEPWLVLTGHTVMVGDAGPN
jgi:glyoxylase-like metal-dependent hydrolase (beta-lactamase superfamily II)